MKKFLTFKIRMVLLAHPLEKHCRRLGIEYVKMIVLICKPPVIQFWWSAFIMRLTNAF